MLKAIEIVGENKNVHELSLFVGFELLIVLSNIYDAMKSTHEELQAANDSALKLLEELYTATSDEGSHFEGKVLPPSLMVCLCVYIHHLAV